MGLEPANTANKIEPGFEVVAKHWGWETKLDCWAEKRKKNSKKMFFVRQKLVY